MNRGQAKGFTIIEVMLFLAITGVITVLFLMGWTKSVHTQSYKDGVNSVLADVQLQFDEAYNPINERKGNLTCIGDDVNTAESSNTNIGSTDCVVMGRYIVFDKDKIIKRRVIGFDATSTNTSDTNVIKDYKPQYVADTAEAPVEYTLPWGMEMYKPGADRAPLTRALVIIRSPMNGAVTSYTWEMPTGEQKSVLDIINSGSQEKFTICLDPKAPVSTTPLALTVSANASTHEAVGIQSKEGGNGC